MPVSHLRELRRAQVDEHMAAHTKQRQRDHEAPRCHLLRHHLLRRGRERPRRTAATQPRQKWRQ